MNNLDLTAAIRAAACTPVEPSASDEVSRDYRFAADFPGFSGHFPGAPILPAVVQIEMSRLLAEEWLGASLRLLVVDQAKFLQPVRPGEQLRLTCRILSRSDVIRCDVRLACDDQPVAGFRLTFGAAED